jgi:hypothetical protein
MSDTYEAELVGPDGSESIELTFIDGLPQKSFTRPAQGETGEDDADEVWELDPASEGVFRYELAGKSSADYS